MEPDPPLQQAVTSSPEKQPSVTVNRMFKNLSPTSQKTTGLFYREKLFRKKQLVYNENTGVLISP
jgi:hypothetical protein